MFQGSDFKKLLVWIRYGFVAVFFTVLIIVWLQMRSTQAEQTAAHDAQMRQEAALNAQRQSLHK